MKARRELIRTISVLLGTSVIAGAMFLNDIVPAGRVSAQARGSRDVATTQPTTVALESEVTEQVASTGVYFEENRGQQHERVRYMTRGSGTTMFLTDTEAVYVLQEAGVQEPVADTPRTATAIYMSLVGADAGSPAVGISELEHKTSYFRGTEANWITGVPNFRAVTVPEIYPGVNITWQGDPAGEAVPVISAAPFADLSRLKWEIRGADSVTVGGEGQLVIEAGDRTMTLPTPVASQNEGDLAASYDVLRASDKAFKIAYRFGSYSPELPVEIRPAEQRAAASAGPSGLRFSTFVGGSNDEVGVSIFVDDSNNILVAGSTSSTNFPTVPGSFDTTNNFWDGFVFKMNPRGTGLIYSTFIGGDSEDYISRMKVDPSGNVYLCGLTKSTDFPTVAGSYDISYNGGNFDAFVTKMNPTGTALIYSTFLGGALDDRAHSLEIDSSGNVYVAGFVFTGNGPIDTSFPTTKGAYDTTPNGNWDAFLTKFNPGGTGLVYSTLFGGSGGEDGQVQVAVDSSGNAYIAGATTSSAPSFPITSGVVQPTRIGSYDCYAAKFDPTGSSLVYSTFLGGSQFEVVNDIKVNANGELYLTGQTSSSNFPVTAGSYDTSQNGGADVFLTRLNPTATALIYSTFIGLESDDIGTSMVMDANEVIYLTGETGSANFPTTVGAFDTTHNGVGDVFILKFDPSLPGSSALLYSTFLGSGNTEAGRAIFVTAPDVVYVTGWTRSVINPMFPTTVGAFDTTPNGVDDAFVTKFVAAPTASGAYVMGRVLTPEGQPFRNANVAISGPNGFLRVALTSSFGYFRIDEVPVGQVYQISVNSKQYQFATQLLEIRSDINDLEFIGLP